MLTSSTRLETASASSTALPTAITPALFTNTSIGPNWSSTVSRKSVKDRRSVTSKPAGNRQPQPAAGFLDGGFVDIADRDLGAQTVQRVAMARPIPRAPPVTADLVFQQTRVSSLHAPLVPAQS